MMRGEKHGGDTAVARAPNRLRLVSDVLTLSASARSFAPAAPMPFPARAMAQRTATPLHVTGAAMRECHGMHTATATHNPRVRMCA